MEAEDYEESARKLVDDAVAQQNAAVDAAIKSARMNQFWLTVRFGGSQRYTDTDGKDVRRYIQLRDCRVLDPTKYNMGGEEGQLKRGDEIGELWIYEANPVEEAIGTMHMLAMIELTLPPAAFAEFWAASASAVGAMYDVSIQFKYEGPSSYTIMKAKLVEHLPQTVDYNPKAHAPGYIPGRVHPVVAELRDMQRRLIGSWNGFLITIGFFVGIIVLIQILQAAWQFLQH
jgi:hypothetical protein